MRIINIIDTLDPNSGVFDVVNTFGDNLKKEKIQIDYIYFFETKRSKKVELIEEGHKLLKLNLKDLILNFKKSNKKIDNFLDIDKRNQTVIHNHVLLFSNIIMPYFKKNKISLSIGHAHSSTLSNSVIKNIRNKILLFNSNRYYDVFFGCSGQSINTWFSKTNKEKDRVIIPNPINCKIISNAITNYTTILNQNTIILGTVGRLVKEKNQDFLFDIIKDIEYEFPRKKIILKIIGEGPLKQMLVNKHKKEYNNLNIKFYDYMDKSDLYQEILSFNYFLLPSIKEGLGITLIESQMLGIYSIASCGVPKEADIGNLERLQLSRKLWSEKIIDLLKKEKKVIPNIDNMYCADSASNLLRKKYLYYLR